MGIIKIKAEDEPTRATTRDMFTNSGTEESAGGIIQVFSVIGWNDENAGIDEDIWSVEEE